MVQEMGLRARDEEGCKGKCTSDGAGAFSAKGNGAYLYEELVEELLGPAMVEGPRLGGVTDVCAVDEQRQNPRLLYAMHRKQREHSLRCTESKDSFLYRLH